MVNLLTGNIIAEKYRLGELLRSNENGDLYDARHVLMDKQVAVLILRPGLAVDIENVERFFERSKTASKISHPHVLNINDFGTDREGYVYAIYEPLNGRPLSEYVAEEGAFPIYSAVEAARQTAEALSASNVAGQVHGNLTTGNILLTGSEGINVKVVDVGSPNPLIEERAEAADFAYLPPEQCSGSDQADQRSDVYALGVVLYEMLAGVPPFIGEKPTDVMLRHIEEMPSPLSAFRGDLPPGLEPVIVKSLSKNPDMRQQSAQEFADELVTATTSLAPPPPAESQNNLWKTAFIVLVGMSLLSAFLIYGTYTNRTDPTTAIQPDANGMPVQPINPATGTEEQNLAAMPALTVDAIANSNSSQIPGTLPGGDNYNPWGNGGAPPPGAPYTPPGGQVVTIDPNNPSQFMPMDGGVVLVPVPANTAANTAKPTPTPKPNANTNTNSATVPTPQTNPSLAKPTPTPAARPTKTPIRNNTPVNKPEIDDKRELD